MNKKEYGIVDTNTTLAPIYQEIYTRTFKDETLRRETRFVNNFFEEWIGNFVHPFGDDLFHGNKLKDSIYYCYLASESNVYDWLAHSLLCGAYEVVLRELRCILEGVFTSYFIDTHFSNLNLSEKLKKLSNNNRITDENGKELSIKKIFKLSGINQWNEYYNLYKELCNYVHMSRIEKGLKIYQIARKGYPEALNACFNRDIFLKSVVAWKRIAILSINLASSLLDYLNIKNIQTNPHFFKEI